MATFQKGDKVVCVNDYAHSGSNKQFLKKGEVYIVEFCYSNGISTEEVYLQEDKTRSWLASRFALYQEVSLHPIDVKPMILVDDYTCKRCRNNKLSHTEKSCWSCGETISP